MKKIFLFLSIALVFAVPSVKAQSWNYQYFDTLDNSAALTYTIDPSWLGKSVWDISTTLQADSVSGGTAGVAYFQVSNHDTGNYWITLFSTTINGVQTLAFTEDELRARRARLYVTGGGTQRTFVRFAINAVKKY